MLTSKWRAPDLLESIVKTTRCRLPGAFIKCIYPFRFIARKKLIQAYNYLME
uniref:Uncharacterized protein n=1 Tax=Oryza brachyantha TaxID=4533 RepID=J3N3M7_ORYBR